VKTDVTSQDAVGQVGEHGPVRGGEQGRWVRDVAFEGRPLAK
jgi:hypothetical protein